MNSISIKTAGLIRSKNEKAMAKGNGKKMEAKQFTISEELTPNRVEKKKNNN